jgi:hypothetical protein
MDLLERRDAIAELATNLQAQLEAQVAPLRDDVEQQVAAGARGGSSRHLQGSERPESAWALSGADAVPKARAEPNHAREPRSRVESAEPGTRAGMRAVTRAAAVAAAWDADTR